MAEPPDPTAILLAPLDKNVTLFSRAHICWVCRATTQWTLTVNQSGTTNNKPVRNGSSENHMVVKMMFLTPFLVKFNGGVEKSMSKHVKVPKVPLSVWKVMMSGVLGLFLVTSPKRFHFLYLKHTPVTDCDLLIWLNKLTWLLKIHFFHKLRSCCTRSTLSMDRCRHLWCSYASHQCSQWCTTVFL